MISSKKFYEEKKKPMFMKLKLKINLSKICAFKALFQTHFSHHLCIKFFFFSFFTALNMSGNSIPILSARQFSSLGLINLQRVSMSRCGLAQVDGHAFAGLTNMVELDLSSNQLQEVNKSI